MTRYAVQTSSFGRRERLGVSSSTGTIFAPHSRRLTRALFIPSWFLGLLHGEPKARIIDWDAESERWDSIHIGDVPAGGSFTVSIPLEEEK
jgi:hypothetical protein